MSDFPFGGDSAKIGEWLDKKKFKNSFKEFFNEWDADAILGITDEDIKSIDKGATNDAMRLCALLKTTRNSKYFII
jgi:hypothetical protein